MSAELAAGVVADELGAAPETVFAEWDPVPIAAASIGQVHRATLPNGRAVAVKVQRPEAPRTGACRACFEGLRLDRIAIIGGGPIGEFTAETLLKMMLGERQNQTAPVVSPPQDAMGPGITLSGITSSGTDGRSALRDVTLEVQAGQIVGIAAVAGNGQAGLADACALPRGVVAPSCRGPATHKRQPPPK